MARKITLNLNEMEVEITEYTGAWGGDDFEIQKSVVYAYNDLPESIQAHCGLHGLSQKLTDQTSAMSPAKGFTTNERFGVMDDLFDQLLSGNWKKPSTGTSGKIAPSKVAKAAEEMGMTVEQVALLMKSLGH